MRQLLRASRIPTVGAANSADAENVSFNDLDFADIDHSEPVSEGLSESANRLGQLPA